MTWLLVLSFACNPWAPTPPPEEEVSFGCYLKGGAEEWKWVLSREGQKAVSGCSAAHLFIERPDLADYDHPGANLIGLTSDVFVWIRVKMPDAVLVKLVAHEGATLHDVDIAGADLEIAHLQGADLRDVNLSGARVESAGFFGTTMLRVDATAIRGRTAYFFFDSMTEVRFDRARLPESRINVKQAEQVWFDDADLQDASLGLEMTRDVSFARADLRGSTWMFTDLTGVSLEGADLRGASFQHAKGAPRNCGGMRWDGSTVTPTGEPVPTWCPDAPLAPAEPP